MSAAPPVLLALLLCAACEKQPTTRTPPAPKDDGRPMVRIEGGAFRMGSDDPDAGDDERPVHDVTVKTFELDAYEVTAADYVRFLATLGTHECREARDGWCVNPGLSNPATPYPIERAADGKTYRVLAGRDRHPVHGVSRTGAAKYCAWAGKRLPTEAEWEYAARHDPTTGKDRAYPWGDRFEPKRANCAEEDCADGFDDTAPVGSFPSGATPAGVHDLAGNVLEWTSDCYTSSYAPDAACDPGGQGVTRGLYFNSRGGVLRASNRSPSPDTTGYGSGFRCARDAR